MRDRAHHLAGEVVDTVQETAGRVTGMGQGEGQSGSVTDQAAEQVTSRLDMGKDFVVETMTEVAQALRQTGQHLREGGSQSMLAGYVDRGAEQVERIGGHMRQRDAKELLAEVEWFARRQPMAFAAGSFALGMLAVRFLRSSGQQAQQGATPSGATSSTNSYANRSPGSSSGSQGATAGVPPTSYSVPPRPASSSFAAPGTVPSGTGSMPTRSPGAPSSSPASPQATEYTDSSLGLSPKTPSSPRESTESPSEPVTPRSASVPSSGSVSGGTRTPVPGAGTGAQPGSQTGDDASGSGRTAPGSRNQP